MKLLIKCHGGKWYMKNFIIDHFPENYSNLEYFELFGGGASVLLNKKPSILEVYNDKSINLANIFWHAVNRPLDLINGIKNIEYSEEVFKKALKKEMKNDLDSAINEIILRRMSRGGTKKYFAWSERLAGGRPGDLNAWENFKDNLIEICDRLKNVKVYSKSAIDILKEQKHNENALFYLDPPYVLKTRNKTKRKIYDYEMTDEEHIELYEALNQVKGKVLISGYNCDLYQELYKSWNVFSKEVANHSGQNTKKQKRVEFLWRNF